MFNNYLFDKHLLKACLAAMFAIGLTACSSSSDTATAPDPEPTPAPDPAMVCTDAGGQWNADDMMCTSAEELELAALRAQITDLAAQLGVDADDIGDTVAELQATLKDLQDAADEEQRKAAEAAAAAMAATAAKLYAGISAPSGTNTDTATGTRSAAYDGDDINVRIVLDADGDGTADTPIDATLSENEDAMVADNRGWTGKMYADPAGGDMVEAYVYSNVAAPTMGKKFGGAAANDEFEYALTDGELANATIVANPARVVISGVTRTAGTETFELPDPNTNNEQDITRSGSFHGVSGTYICDTGAARDQACTASVATMGLTLSSNWTFEPSDADARVMGIGGHGLRLVRLVDQQGCERWSLPRKRVYG